MVFISARRFAVVLVQFGRGCADLSFVNVQFHVRTVAGVFGIIGVISLGAGLVEVVRAVIAFSGDARSWDDAFLPFFAAFLIAFSVPPLLCSFRLFRHPGESHKGSIIFVALLTAAAVLAFGLFSTASRFDARFVVILVPPLYGLWALTRKR